MDGEAKETAVTLALSLEACVWLREMTGKGSVTDKLNGEIYRAVIAEIGFE